VSEIEGSRELGSSQGKGPNIWYSKSRVCEVARFRPLEDRWPQQSGEVEYRWQKPSGSRCEKSRGIGIRIRELRSAEGRVNVWQKHEVGPRGRRVDTRWWEIKSAFR
jgi:hypothetical protein